jgi:signal transduction histidine kinase
LRVADLNLCRHNLSHEQREFLSDFERGVIAETAQISTGGNALAMSDCEDELIDWLEKQHIDEGWRLAPILAETGIDIGKLEQISDKVPIDALKDVLTRLVVQITVSKLAGEIKTSVTRISDLVGAIKEYSYMDQAAVQAIDLCIKGLDNTLLILKHKLKTKNITVTREYAENLPRITAHGSLLNQVWTNLIDNAVDAMPAGGKLKIHKLEPGDVLIEIRDNGAGIPPEMPSAYFRAVFHD